MTVGAGTYLNPAEKDPIKQNAAFRQVLEGRSNAVGTFTLASSSTGGTTVTAQNCSTSSTVQLMPLTQHAAWEVGIYFVTPGKGKFTVSHSTNGSTDRTFTYAIQG